MTYENAVEKIHSLLTFGSRPGLDRMRILLDRLGNLYEDMIRVSVGIEDIEDLVKDFEAAIADTAEML